MLHAMALALALVLALASPAAAETFDFSWASLTTLRLGQFSGADVVGGTISGRDPAATWDRNTGTLLWRVDGQTFGGFLDRSGDDWFGSFEVPSHPDYIAARFPPANAEAPIHLVETATGFLMGGSFGSMGEVVSFGGTGLRVASGGTGSVAAPEPAGLLLTVVGLAGALRLRRRLRAYERIAVIEAGDGFPGDRRALGGVGGHVGAPHELSRTA